MPHSFFEKIIELIDGGTPLAVATVLSTQGSTPQCAGTRAIMEASGRLWGTVGGGMVEAKARQAAVEACRTGRPSIFDCDMTNVDAANEGAVCGGSMRVLSTRRSPDIALALSRPPVPWWSAAKVAC